MPFLRQILPLLLTALVLGPLTALDAQVTTATLYGVVRDSTGAVLPGASVTATHRGTNQSRDTLTDERGDFALPALPSGPYVVKIELPGFKTFINQGLELGAGQTVRQAFVLEVGQLAENITVAETAPLVETASAAQAESLGMAEVTQLPIARRNLVSMMDLTTGVSTASTGRNGSSGASIRLNGVGDGGTLATIDGTDASSNPESRGIVHYGDQSQISMMSVEAVAEVQIIKGILPAEYGGFVGGQVNLISRSGTNQFHGSGFANYQNEKLFARNAFLTRLPKPVDRFKQFGGSVGGPVLQNRVFFFTAYEGYRENGGIEVSGTVPTAQLRNQVLAASPFKETEIVLSTLPQPNEPIDGNIGRWRGVRDRKRSDNHVVAKGDVRVFDGNLSLTYTRMRPYTVDPTFFVGRGNNTEYFNKSDRIAAQYVLARGSWISESRFGWNRSLLDRVGQFWLEQDPNSEPDTEITSAARRVGIFSISGLFSTPEAELLHLEGVSYTGEQKLSRVVGAHNMKLGFRWARQGGERTNPQNPNYSYLSFADFQANIPNSVQLYVGQPPHAAHLDEYGAFFQDDWRVNPRLMLSLGLRYDYHPTFRVSPKTDAPAVLYNLNPPSDLRLMDFGAPRDADKPYDPSRMNFGPRFGLVWALDGKEKTVVRVGAGLLRSQHQYATLQNLVSNPFVPNRVLWNRTEVAGRGLKWPMYSRQLSDVAVRDAAGRAIVFGLINVHLPTPYTVQSMINVQRAISSTLMAEIGYIRTDGRNFPLSRPLSKAFDRRTGLRPNPAIGSPAGNYLSSEQTMVYNALQTSVRKRLSSNLGFDIHYTLAKGWAQQGGGLSSSFINTDLGNVQDFWDGINDKYPISEETRHRLTGDVIYELPWLRNASGILPHILGGWRISSVYQIRTGVPLSISQPSGIGGSRPDLLPDVDPVFSNWRDTLQFLNPAAFARVPTYPVTNATIRPGNQNPGDVRGPGFFKVDLSLSKTFRLSEAMSLQVRADAFNAFNRVNYSNPNNNMNSPQFGLITTAAAARTAQLGARFTF
jgi:outer membrane receptor protein involved in Fe transport